MNPQKIKELFRLSVPSFANKTFDDAINKTLKHIQNGIDYYSEADYNEAFIEFDRAISINSYYESAYTNRGICRLISDDFDGALVDFDKAVNLSPNDAITYLNRARVKKMLGIDNLAIDYKRAFELNELLLDKCLARFSYRNEEQYYEEALEYLDEAIMMSPPCDTLYFDRAEVKKKICDFTGAIADLNMVISLNPQHDDAYCYRGLFSFFLKDYIGAIIDYDFLVKKDPNEVSYYSNRAIVKSFFGDHYGAIADYDMAIHLNPNDTLVFRKYYNRMKEKEKIEDYEGAKVDYEKSESLSKIRKTEKEWIEACNNNYDIISSFFHWTHVCIKKANENISNGLYSEAIANCDIAIHLDPDDSNGYALRGCAKGELDNNIAALEDFDMAIMLNPEDEYSYYNRGITKQKMGLHVAAIVDFEKAKELGLDISIERMCEEDGDDEDDDDIE